MVAEKELIVAVKRSKRQNFFPAMWIGTLKNIHLSEMYVCVGVFLGKFVHFIL